MRIICGTRTYDEQDALYAKRPKVTNAKGGQSMHNFGLAWDFGLFNGKAYLGDSPHYRPLAYRMLLDDGSYTDLPAPEVLHIFDPDSISQVRGYPRLLQY